MAPARRTVFSDTAEFGVVFDSCSNQALPPGGECVVAVRFTSFQDGPLVGVLSLPTNDPFTPVVEIPMSGSTSGTIGGSVTNMTPVTLLCRNVTTGQSLQGPFSLTSWDCEMLGLVVNPGDRVITGVVGIAN